MKSVKIIFMTLKISIILNSLVAVGHKKEGKNPYSEIFNNITFKVLRTQKIHQYS